MEKIVDKITKLLALATSSNVHEATLALQKAQELALKHNMNISEIAEKKEEVVTGRIEENSKSVSVHRKLMAQVLSKHFRVKVFTSTNRFTREQRIVVVGFSEDVQVYQSIFEWTYRVFKSLALQAINERKRMDSSFETRSQSLRFQNTYFQGFLKGIDKAFEDNENKFALIVVAPKEVDQYMKTLRLGTATTSLRTASDSAALERGYKDGYDSQKLKSTLM